MTRGADPAGRLEIRDVRAGYGGTEILHGVSLYAEPGECVAIVGRNGAGKSTLLNAIAGTVRVTGGAMRLGDVDLLNLKPHERVRRGLGSTMEGHRVFASMTVADNLAIAGRAGGRSPITFDADMERVLELFPILSDRADRKAATLSGGQQQMLAISQALMTRPSVILLDEPSAGLAPLLVTELFAGLQALLDSQDLTVVIVEQAVSQVLRIATRGYVLNLGSVVLEASASELANDPEVASTYVGRQHRDTGERNGV